MIIKCCKKSNPSEVVDVEFINHGMVKRQTGEYWYKSEFIIDGKSKVNFTDKAIAALWGDARKFRFNNDNHFLRKFDLEIMNG